MAASASSSSSPPFVAVVIVVNAVALSTPMAETVGGLALLVREKGVLTPPLQHPGLGISLGRPVIDTLGLGRLGLFGFHGGASRLVLAHGGCHFDIFDSIFYVWRQVETQ
jgi:hypothetical protein